MGHSYLKAQPGNGELYQSLWKQELDSLPHLVKAIQGPRSELFFPQYDVDSSSAWTLRLLDPFFSYKKIGKSTYLRSFSQSYQLEGKGLIGGRISARDTLSQKQVKAQLKSSKLPPELKGENPFFFSKYVAPGLWILGSFGAIFSLFYIRSR